MKTKNVAAEVTRPNLEARSRYCLTSAAALLLVFVASVRAQDYAYEKSATQKAPLVAVPLTPEEKTQLAAIDARFAAVEALVARIDDPVYKATTLSAIADIKRRRASLEKKFDPASYETLMHSVIGRYQIISLWLKPPRIAAPAATAATPAASATKSQDKPASQ